MVRGKSAGGDALLTTCEKYARILVLLVKKRGRRRSIIGAYGGFCRHSVGTLIRLVRRKSPGYSTQEFRRPGETIGSRATRRL